MEGVIKFAIGAVVVLGLGYMITQSQYRMTVTTSDISIEVSPASMQHDDENQEMEESQD